MRTLIALLLTLLLTGCGASAMTMVTGSPPPSAPAPEENGGTVRYEVEVAQWSDEALAEDGTLLASYAFQLPVLTAVREDGTPITEARSETEEQALTAAAAFNEKFGKWVAAEEFDDLVKSAETDFAWYQTEALPWFGGYTLALDCTVYQTDRIISVEGLYYSYTGGAHPNTWQLGWNFDLEEGVFFGPELLADGTELQEAVSREIVRQAQLPSEDGTVPVKGYWEDYEAIIANWASYTVNFDEDGMIVTFSPYELGCYAMGAQTFRLSYDWLEPHLSAHGRALLGLETE